MPRRTPELRRAGQPTRPPGQLRLIGGHHGGRRLPILTQPGLRPTGERIRETLFNWLQPRIAGSHCLDVFAGSGALGFEALSRGAARVVMLERNAAVVQQLRINASLLSGQSMASPSDQDCFPAATEKAGEDSATSHSQPETRVEIHAVDSLHWLTNAATSPFDLVFLDPPFAEQCLPDCLDALSARAWLAPAARVYLETSVHTPFPELPPGWAWLREKTAGQVRFGLAATETRHKSCKLST
jgi:16S rRNA (guanine966-N2)-methyltransferase